MGFSSRVAREAGGNAGTLDLTQLGRAKEHGSARVSGFQLAVGPIGSSRRLFARLPGRVQAQRGERGIAVRPILPGRYASLTASWCGSVFAACRTVVIGRVARVGIASRIKVVIVRAHG